MTKVTALPADDKQCAWYHLSNKRQAKPSHSGNSAARWAIVGAGYNTKPKINGRILIDI